MGLRGDAYTPVRGAIVDTGEAIPGIPGLSRPKDVHSFGEGVGCGTDIEPQRGSTAPGSTKLLPPPSVLQIRRDAFKSSDWGEEVALGSCRGLICSSTFSLFASPFSGLCATRLISLKIVLVWDSLRVDSRSKRSEQRDSKSEICLRPCAFSFCSKDEISVRTNDASFSRLLRASSSVFRSACFSSWIWLMLLLALASIFCFSTRTASKDSQSCSWRSEIRCRRSEKLVLAWLKRTSTSLLCTSMSCIFCASWKACSVFSVIWRFTSHWVCSRWETPSKELRRESNCWFVMLAHSLASLVTSALSDCDSATRCCSADSKAWRCTSSATLPSFSMCKCPSSSLTRS
mmetsp:Transcript_126627/g.300842  ORF Transcript_126627/g.300842 Transcript_126627/m.300842 type:complete len:345 (-) Transcript_126627:672-1706(-)